jgi:BirA family transcriptional regulator, biotin operon repressor / biotin---[acetyl-CoA-carboxylase] ligase
MSSSSLTTTDGPYLARQTGLAEVRIYASVDSTSRQAEILVARGELALPAAVLALRQTAGRGRGEHAWWSGEEKQESTKAGKHETGAEGGATRLAAAATRRASSGGGGSLTVTFVYPIDPDRPPGQLPLRAGLAVYRTVAGYIPAKLLRLKWPNDLLADGKKIAGILCQRVPGVGAEESRRTGEQESRRADPHPGPLPHPRMAGEGAIQPPGTDLIGIGLNIATDFSAAPAEVRRRAASLAAFTPRPPTLSRVFLDLARNLRDMAAADDWLDRFNAVHVLHGQAIAVNVGPRILRGTCRGIDVQGCLLLNDGRKTHAIHFGQVVAWPGRID